MKAKLIRSDLDVALEWSLKAYGQEFVDENSAPNPNGQKLGGKPIRRWKWGTIIEHPTAWKLCRAGSAEPVDDECREMVGLTGAELEDLQARYNKLSRDGSYEEELTDAATATEIIDEGEDV